MWKVEVVSQLETTGALPEAEIRDLLALREAEVNFSIQLALEADLASHTAYRCWREASLVYVETERDSLGVCLVLQ